ncbi:MAG: heme exporter protein CcmB [Ktedonobacteraceae bacterium]|nr:heme exporter protein CcmB [Ktedonobacteraceae bacterium]
MIANGRIVQVDKGEGELQGRRKPQSDPHPQGDREGCPYYTTKCSGVYGRDYLRGRPARAILWKDVRYELRSKQTWIGMGMFALLVLVIFNFAFDLRVDNKAAVAPGALWVAFLFASLLGLGRTLAAEREQGPLDRLLLCPVDRKAIYLAKLLGNVLFIAVVEIVALPIFAALFDVPLFVGALLPTVLFGTLGIATIGTLFSTMVAATRARELLLPVLVFPLLVPVVIAAVRATGNLLVPSVNEPPWLGLIIAFDAIFLSISLLTFEYIVEE